LDNVERVLSDIENDPEIIEVRFTGLLDDVANIAEKHGFGMAKAFLMEKQSHGNLRRQAKALSAVLEKIEKYPDISADRKTVRLIVKAVVALKSTRGRQR
jgi:hypothetical protein